MMLRNSLVLMISDFGSLRCMLFCFNEDSSKFHKVNLSLIHPW